MKKVLVVLSVAAVVLLSQNLQATNVCGNVSGVWDLAGSPYYVTCDVTVPSMQTLQIRPGVQVLFTGRYNFNVLGNLQAIGTEEDSIVFTRAFPTEESKGAGIRIIDAPDTSNLHYCVIEFGHAVADGGGIYCENCYTRVLNSTIRACTADWDGGAIAVVGHGSMIIRNCVLSGNHASHCSGGVVIWGQASVSFLDCIIRQNTAAVCVGGIAVDNYSSASIVSCLIDQNYAVADVGGIGCITSSSLVLDRSTVARNVAGESGGGLYQVGWSNSVLKNTVFWGNSADHGSQIYINNGAFSITYSDIQGGYSGTGNIDADPMFVDTANGDFHLQAGSPCIDTGDPSSPYDPDSTRADMGAYPYFYPCLLVERDSLEFGLLDLGTDSTMQVVLGNPTSQPIPVIDVFCSLSEFSFDTTGLGGQVPAYATYYLSVTFAPSTAGSYTDTLVIAVQQPCDTLIRIPMHGEADVVLPPVDSLVIQRGPMNGIQLDWAPVTHTISGQPVQDVLYAIYGSTSCQGPFFPFGYSTTNSYVHPNILNGQPMYFYQVTADVGSGRRTR